MSSKIYAPVNSVRNVNAIKTNIPLDITISSAQYEQLSKLEADYFEGIFNETKLAKKHEVISVNNPGIFFFCLEQNFALLHLAKNPNLDSFTAMLLNNKLNVLSSASDATGGRKLFSERYALLVNPTVLSDLNLFRIVFSSISDSDKAVIVESLISHIGEADVEVLVSIIAWVADVNKERMKTYVSVLKKRENEIEAWAVKNNHEIAGLPTSWILGMYGIIDY